MIRDDMYNGSAEKKIQELETGLQKTVKTVNGKVPDNKGNVQVDGAPTGDFATKDDIKGMVKKVNNTSPDVNGNVPLTGFVKQINGGNPDANGNVTGIVKQVNGVTPDGTGKVTGFVQSVNGATPDATGKVTLPLFPAGLTAARPSTGTVSGQPFFDTTLNKPIWRNATNNGWVDATGTAVV